MKTQPTHTPTPWKVNICSPKHNQKGITIQTQDGIVLAHIQWQLDDSEKSNAAFIVECVNQHAALKAANEELLQSLKDVLSCYKRVWADAGKDQKGSLYIGIAEKAIARASGEGASHD